MTVIIMLLFCPLASSYQYHESDTFQSLHYFDTNNHFGFTDMLYRCAMYIYEFVGFIQRYSVYIFNLIEN